MKPLMALIAALVLSMTGCAAGPRGPGHFQGTAGPVSWQVVDLVQTRAPDHRAARWDYTVVLTNTSSVGITFATLYGMVRALSVRQDMFASPAERVFSQRLEPGASLRVNDSETVFYTAWAGANPALTFHDAVPGAQGMIRTLRFVGRSDDGVPVSASVDIPLDPSVGALSHPATTRKVPPPAQSLKPDERRLLTGEWHGSYRNQYELDTPLTVVVKDDGSFEGVEGEPARSRFRGTLGVRDGQVTLSTGANGGLLTFHQGDGVRVLDGRVTSSGGDLDVWLESTSPAPGVVPSP